MKFIKKFFKNIVPKKNNETNTVVSQPNPIEKIKPISDFIQDGGFDLDDKAEKVSGEKADSPVGPVKKKPGRPKGAAKKTPSKKTPSKNTPSKK